ALRGGGPRPGRANIGVQLVHADQASLRARGAGSRDRLPRLGRRVLHQRGRARRERRPLHGLKETTMARLPYVEPETAPTAVREILERLPVKLNIFKMMAHAETSFRPLLQLGTSILAQQHLSAKLRELAILHVARLSPAEYEWVQHVPIAEAAGASTAQVEALRAGQIEAPCFDEVERLVLRFTTEVVRN